LTKIYCDPFVGFLSYLAEHCDDALDAALNLTNRPTKKKKFRFSTSEDHVTWTLFHFLLHERALASTFKRLGVVADTPREPDLLLWGVPIPFGNHEGAGLRKQIEMISNELCESRNSRSEPDAILNFADAGLMFIEVKLGSRNDHKPSDYTNFDRYVKETDAFVNPEQAKSSGLYELVRNWRFACASGEGHPVVVVNLGPESLFKPPHDKALIEFEQSLNRKPNRVFRRITWKEFLAAIPNKPNWLNKYIQERKILDHVPPAEDAAL